MPTRFSILQPKMDRCWVCGTTRGLHIHEVYYGTYRRQVSIKYGCCVALCGRHHNLSSEGVHNNPALDLKLKQEMQRAFIKTYPDVDFIKTFRKSYL